VKLTHVRLLVDVDLYEECFRFYRDTLGLEATFGDEGGPYADFATGDATIALFTRTGQGEAVDLLPPGDGSLVVLHVDDLDAEVERLREHVVAGPLDREDWGIRVAYVRDPADNLIELNREL
jgi:lactoylglutathione lyase